ncbi:PQQ-dependent sugar dehydrogenase [Saccharomonospora piscinae]|uniref:PQQ-dependent sugar dehydrogenase n=1 Tax=Saccharomonospora piscinae TaxID=687388 RepID=UPI000463E889|nr:PQQ-dependent sugar dehydrogenase [Saccharomonospora piscinae]
MRRGPRRSWSAVVLACAVVVPAGCADFDDSTAETDWRSAPELSAEAGPQPQLPEAEGSAEPGGPSTSQTPVPPPEGCTDYDKAVIATCLDTVSAVAALPSDGSSVTALAGERRSGEVFLVNSDGEPQEYATLDVEPTGDGGLTGLALSPTYAEDGLVFAYLTTAEDNRVVRFAEGQEPQPVLTGIPKGADHNRGALLAGADGSLLVATGDAGDAAAAADRTSLAGKILRIDPSGAPAGDNPAADSAVYARGLHAPGGMCGTEDGSRLWVTDQTADRDAVYRIEAGEELSVPAWTWKDRPGVSGCADWTDMLAVSTEQAGNIQNLPLTEDGSVGGEPQLTLDGEDNGYGLLGSLDQVTGDVAVAGTINKDGGTPVSSDDRVVLIVRQPASGSGRD